MAKPKTLHPDREQTLREALASSLGISKGRAKELLDARAVLVNGKRVWMAKHLVDPRDTIEVLLPEERSDVPLPIPILWEKGAFLVVNKPAGLLANGPDSVEVRCQHTLRCKSIQAAHRLDRETSGCLLLVRSSTAFEEATSAFASGGVHKEYTVLVLGLVPETLTRIDRPLDGKTAVTRIEGITLGAGASLLRVVIETGRTHQIRRHLAGVGYPVIGDRHYLTGAIADERVKSVGRQMLHAARIALTIPPSGLRIDARAPLPEDLRAAARLFQLPLSPEK